MARPGEPRAAFPSTPSPPAPSFRRRRPACSDSRLPAPSPVATVAARALLPTRGRFCLLRSSCTGLRAMQIKAEAVAKILGGRRVSGGFLCHCPVVAHGKGRGDVHPSLTIADGDRALLYTCHAGCDPRAIRGAIDNLDLRGEPLYASAQNSSSGSATPKTTSARALALWRGARPVVGTPAETYLRERGFDEPPPATIRFLPRYRYEPGGKYYACMIAAISSADARDRRCATDVSPLGRKAQGRCSRNTPHSRASWRGRLAPRGRRRAYWRRRGI